MTVFKTLMPQTGQATKSLGLSSSGSGTSTDGLKLLNFSSVKIGAYFHFCAKRMSQGIT